jgi:cytochrome c biogenesis protein CcdA
MIRQALFITLAVLSASLRALTDPGPARLLVLQSNANNGYLYPCRCPNEPKGGLAKRATLIKQLTKGNDQFLLFDSGDILGLDSDRKTDSLVLAAYQAMGYRAVAVGDQELSHGAEYFLDLAGKFKTPFLAANLSYNGRPLAKSYVVIRLSDPPVKVGVIGATWPKAFIFYPKAVTQNLEATDPEAALRPVVDSLRPKVDVLILLSHLGFDQEVEIAKEFPEFDLIIGGHTQTELKEPDRSGGVPVIEAGSGSKYLTESWLAPEGGRWKLGGYRMAGITSTLAEDKAVADIVGRAPVKGHELPADQGQGPLLIHAFVAPDCPDCQRLERGLFAGTARQHGAQLMIVYHQVDDPVAYKLLLEYEEKLGDRNNKIPAVVIGNRILGGVEEIERDFPTRVRELLEKTGAKAATVPAPSTAPAPAVKPVAKQGGIQAGMPAKPAAGPDSIYLAFVTNARCAKCGRAEYMIKALQNSYPALVVRKYDLESVQDRPMIEAMGLLYGLPPDQRMLAPIAYVGGDHLITGQVDDRALSALLEKYKAGTKRVPWFEAEPYLMAAGQSILQRFRSFGVLGVIAAGLLDGVNPCSLAVLVFFISYLSFVGRKRWEILAVGIAYTLADFLVYFLIGIGSLSFLMSLSALPVLSRALYWIAVAAGLVLAFYNFRDYLKARRGDFSGMDLHLSTAAKQRIHRVIRERMGAGSLITGAFVAGLITSVLEFACTGQVYLPTIAFVAQIAPLRLQAYGYLLLYNLMFEVPMIATFVIAFWGVSSKRIADWAKASVPAVKLATALLFLGMSAVLLWVLVW